MKKNQIITQIILIFCLIATSAVHPGILDNAIDSAHNITNDTLNFAGNVVQDTTDIVEPRHRVEVAPYEENPVQEQGYEPRKEFSPEIDRQ